MHGSLLFFLIVFPFLAGLASLTVRHAGFRKALVLATAVVVSVASLTLASAGAFTASPQHLLGLDLDTLIMLADFALLFVILGIGVQARHPLVIAVAVVQLALLSWLDFFLVDGAEAFPAFVNDSLSSTVSLVVALVGSAIAVFALPYMQAHEQHMASETRTCGEPRFFAVILLFFGAMHGLILSNNLLHLYFFFEITSLCSYLLIGHDRTAVARRNSLIALWMNSLGGVALLLGAWVLQSSLGTLEIQAIAARAPGAGLAVFGVAFVAVGGMVKAAQLPFQRWLLGAMVAPTPVSALLHSSTMVKAGVYICLRFAPAYAGTFVSYALALCGGFTFAVAAALALSQSNGKKVLAYSTISNLGLIVACAGINTPTALVVGMMLIVFHAVSKALLFLCVGTVEQEIGSRDIEVMRGVYGRMPFTALVAGLGVLSMILPPFGMLFGKWLAIEAARSNLLAIVLFAVGSALTVMYWARFAGTLLDVQDASLKRTPMLEPQALFTRGALGALCLGALALPLAAPWMYSGFSGFVLEFAGHADAVYGAGYQHNAAAWVPPLYLLTVIGFFFAWRWMRKARADAVQATPYMNGVNLPHPGMFRGPMRSEVRQVSSNYYLDRYFGESRLTVKVNVAAGLLLLLLLGGGL